MNYPPRLEQEYQAARFAEYSNVSRNVAIAGALLALGLWLRDYADDAYSGFVREKRLTAMNMMKD
jgi:hypothetical protein